MRPWFELRPPSQRPRRAGLQRRTGHEARI